MRIVHVIASFSGGGAERLVVSLCNEFATDANLDIHIISLFDIDSTMFLNKDVSKYVTVHTLSKRLGFDFRILIRLFKLLKRLKPDVVNTHLKSFEYNVLSLMLNISIKYFHTIHSEAHLECPNTLNRRIRRIFFKRKVTPISISKKSSKSYANAYQLENDALIYNGREQLKTTDLFSQVKAEIESYKHTPETKVFINVAHLVAVKGHQTLLKVFHDLIKKDEDIVLLIIGARRNNDEEIYGAIEHFSSERIQYLGVKSNVVDYLNAAHAMCIASTIEGVPITLIEAMSAQCIPIATSVGGIPEMITHNKNGLLARNTSEKAIFEAIKEFLNLSEDTKKQIEKNLHDTYVDRFSIQRVASDYLALYKTKLE